MADEEKNVDPRVAEARRKAEAARNRQESPEEREKRLAELKKQAQAKKAQIAKAKGTDGGGGGQAAGAATVPADTGTPGAPGWRVAESGGQQVQATRVEPRAAARPADDGGEMSRRNFLRVGFWSGMGLAAASGAVGFLQFFWPTKVTGFGSVIRVAADRVPAPGEDPVQVPEGKFWLVNLQPGEGAAGDLAQGSEQGGLLALYWKCPHLGCTVPWRGGFNFEGQTGWFRCPCHGSTYNRAGIRVWGPAPRPMDTMAITVNEDGSLDVDTGNITPGAEDNPQRTQPL